MPSHKQKKKKKSHKRSKRRSLSSSEDSCSPLSVPLSDSDSDVSSNEKKLTALVRKTYINHLKQALMLNFENCSQNTIEYNSESVEEMVIKWTRVLEQKALRTCMVSELYRSTMVSIIKQVKSNTNDKKLYIQDKNVSKFESKVPVNKVSQTDSQELTHEIETQTEDIVFSTLERPLSNSSFLEKPYDPARDFSDTNSMDGGVSSSICSVPQSTEIIKNQDICNISSTSDLISFADLPTQEYKVITDSRESNVNKGTCFTECEISKIDSNFSNVEYPPKDPNLNPSFIKKTHGSCNKTNTSSDLTVQNQGSSNVSKNLDERLSALRLMMDRAEDSLLQPTGKSKRSNWFAEETAQSCNLTRILMRMTTRQREKVLMKIKDLFGDENSSLTELSEANLSICRKRIASVVVMELTPIYQGKRIASRHLFKFLAKKITRSVMEKSLAPDTKDIRWRVKKYFEDEKVIMSESDCM